MFYLLEFLSSEYVLLLQQCYYIFFLYSTSSAISPENIIFFMSKDLLILTSSKYFLWSFLARNFLISSDLTSFLRTIFNLKFNESIIDIKTSSYHFHIPRVIPLVCILIMPSAHEVLLFIFFFIKRVGSLSSSPSLFGTFFEYRLERLGLT